MIDVSNAKWDLSNDEKYAVKWLNEHGFDGRLEKQFVSKSVFSITKDGVTDRFELSQGIKGLNIHRYMDEYAKTWEMLCRMKAR